jgi:hypothetical protein
MKKEVSSMDLEANRLPDSEEILQLEQQHRRYSEQLEQLTQQTYLSEDLQLEEVKLKKLKLQIKDQLTARRSSHPGSHPRSYVA